MIKKISLWYSLLIILIFFLFEVKGQAQSIRGKVTDKNNELLRDVYIELMNLNDSLAIGVTKSDSSGKFRFDNLKGGAYLLVFNHSEYESKRFTQILSENQRVTVNIQMTEQVVQLTGGGITIKKEGVKQSNDTLEYNAGNYKVNKDATTENLVSKMPGITTESGVIKAQGEEIKKVTVDGQDFFGDDAAAALKNLPAEVVDKIQIFDRQSDQSQFTGFDDGNIQKTLNIITKPGKNNGQFGKVYGGYGTNERWVAGGNINVFKGKQRFSFTGLSNNINQQNFSSQDILGLTGTTGGQGGSPGGGRGGPQGGGSRPMGGGSSNNFLVAQQNGINTTNSFGFNYSAFGNKKLKLTASYFYNNSINNSASFLNRTYFLSGSNQLYKQGDTGTAKNFNHRVNARLEYTFDSSNSLIWTPSIRLQKNTVNSVFLGMTNSERLDTLNRSFNNNESQNNGYNIGSSLLLRHKFKKPGNTISLNFNTSFNKSDANTQLISVNTYYEPVYFSDNFRQNTDNSGNSYSISPSLSYTRALNLKSSFEINYNPSLNKSKSTKYTNRYDSSSNEYSIVDSLLSNTFDNSNTTQKLGMTYRYKFKKLSYNIGFNVQQVILIGKQTFPGDKNISKSFDNILPNAQLTYQYNKTKNLRINYRTNTQTYNTGNRS